ncbi:MAG: peptide chain release factor N(5)-glutamine methyltransferase, partial [Paracoccus sp. (in: a-proteobacteria)]|nr:peptide chain release factor N(5)-glutamine methyltransferase [Paracoccus sp. (in: a-proteobacteria)]
MNAAQALADAAARLAAAGVDEPARDAARLLAHVLGRAPLFPADIALSPAQAGAFAAAIDARAARRPVAQITGTRAFWNHSFHVTPDTLDPRPDTETLVEAALRKPWASVLDLG